MALVGGPAKAHAQFGLSVVYDPTNFHNAVLRYYQLIAQLNQMRMTYTQIVNQYNLAVQMAHSLPNMASRYATTWAPWRYATAQDAYGNSGAWINGANTGVVPNVLDGYSERRIRSLRTLPLCFLPCPSLSGSGLNRTGDHRTRAMELPKMPSKRLVQSAPMPLASSTLSTIFRMILFPTTPISMRKCPC